MTDFISLHEKQAKVNEELIKLLEQHGNRIAYLENRLLETQRELAATQSLVRGLSK